MDVKLVMFKSSGQRKDFPLESANTVIGRGENCDLRVPLLSVSRRHAQLTLEGDMLSVKDLGSSNGTYVNNQRVTEQQLEAGDRLVIGPIVFTVQIDGEPQQIKPVKTRGQKMAEQASSAAGSDSEDSYVGQFDAEEEVVELEADDVFGGAEVDDEMDIDPIAALEALANEEDEDEDEEV